MKHKRKLVVSDAGPLIQLAVSDHLYILPKLYDVVIPEEVFEETQYYRDLPDALEIAKATRTWLEVKTVRNRSEVTHLVRQKLGKGEAEAIVLCKEVKADGLLTSDRYAVLKAEIHGIRAMNIAAVVREAYNAKVMKAVEVVQLTDKFINQNILDTLYIRQLREEAREWL